MAIDPRKRQKKLERRKAKQKAEKRQLARLKPQGLAARFEQASEAPFLHCCVSAEIWTAGIGQVFVSRQLPNGNIAFASFLVDIYCLGVKNAMAEIVGPAKYDFDLYGKLTREYTMLSLKPECARKLVEGAVAYAHDLGLPPHADYRTAKLIFGDVSAETCIQEYKFGKDGKPFFVSGPFDSPARCGEIMRILDNRCGPEGHHFLIGMPERMQQSLPYEED
jgi:hypothetical protein